jgi:DNA-binding CsgD family transcriptional regulator
MKAPRTQSLAPVAEAGSPHIGGARRTSAHDGERAPEVAALAPALAGLAEALMTGVVLLDASRRLLWANPSGRATLHEHPQVACHGGLVALARAADTQRLQHLVKRAASGPPGSTAVTGALLLRGPDVAPLDLFVLARTWTSTCAAVPVVLAEPGRCVAPSTDLLAAVYGFTPTQAKVAAMLASGLSLAEAARQAGMAEGTARSHLRRLFALTGTHRQAELVAVLLRGAGTIRSP